MVKRYAVDNDGEEYEAHNGDYVKWEDFHIVMDNLIKSMKSLKESIAFHFDADITHYELELEDSERGGYS